MRLLNEGAPEVTETEVEQFPIPGEYVLETEEIGITISITDGIVKLVGLDDLFMGELVEFPDVDALTLNLEYNRVGAAALGSEDSISQDTLGYRTYEEILIPVGPDVLGLVVSPLGEVFIDLWE